MIKEYNNLKEVAAGLREKLREKKYILLFAYNGTGKTRLSMEFKEQGKNGNERDTLYFNAFTEDLFIWENDLDGDSERILKLNTYSSFFDGLEELEMDNRIRWFLNRYTDFDFVIDSENWEIRFSREARSDEGSRTFDDIKISRGEESLFILCFFLAIAEVAMDETIDEYNWVKYIYIDDPISSLDENYAIAVAHDLAQLIKQNKPKENEPKESESKEKEPKEKEPRKIAISTHHALFFNVLCNELSNAEKYFFSRDKYEEIYYLEKTDDKIFFLHTAILKELHEAKETDNIYLHHFNMLRIILEKTASFHGYKKFSDCIKKDDDDTEVASFARLINILNHGDHSLYNANKMPEEYKESFKTILDRFLKKYKFDERLFQDFAQETERV